MQDAVATGRTLQACHRRATLCLSLAWLRTSSTPCCACTPRGYMCIVIMRFITSLALTPPTTHHRTSFAELSVQETKAEKKFRSTFSVNQSVGRSFQNTPTYAPTHLHSAMCGVWPARHTSDRERARRCHPAHPAGEKLSCMFADVLDILTGHVTCSRSISARLLCSTPWVRRICSISSTP